MNRPDRRPNRRHAIIAAALLAGLAGAAAYQVAAVARPAQTHSLSWVVRQRLLQDGGLSAGGIGVEMHGDVALLSGRVDSLLARRRAVALASAVSGVRDVVDLLSVAPVRRSDDDIRRDVESALAADPAISDWPIMVYSVGGTVTLSGSVGSKAEKSLAATAAQGVAGVRRINNDLFVADTGSRADAAVRADIVRRFAWDPWLGDRYLTVSVKHGSVRLGGVVADAEERQRAERLATIAGVQQLQDQIAVQPSLAAFTADGSSDADIAVAIAKALRLDPRLAKARPTVSVHSGEVQLTGRVGGFAARQAAIEDAQYAAGVRQVVDHLSMPPGARPTDKTIARHVHQAFQRDPDLASSDITVAVRSGRVLLRGVVPDAEQRRLAARLARRVASVRGVRNDVTVLRLRPTGRNRDLG